MECEKPTDRGPYPPHNTKQPSQAETKQLPSGQRQMVLSVSKLICSHKLLQGNSRSLVPQSLQSRLKFSEEGGQAESNSAMVTG